MFTLLDINDFFVCCKVASNRTVCYSIFDYFGGATNQVVLLSEMCYYCHVQQSINWWVRIPQELWSDFSQSLCTKKDFTPLVFKNRASHGKWEYMHLPYARHYNPRFVYFLPTFWSSFMYFDLRNPRVDDFTSWQYWNFRVSSFTLW